MTVVKMYCIFARESLLKMNGNRGKMSTQAGHAYLHAFWNAIETPNSEKQEQAWYYMDSERAYKINLVVDTVDELIKLQNNYKNTCGTSLVTDAGFTVFKEPTITCLGIGPIAEENIGEDLKALKVLI